jgi:hypothetical protein
MITNELPKLTRVVIIYSNDGYFLKREKLDEILGYQLKAGQN